MAAAEGPRSFVTVAYVSEIVETPSLLAAYADAFGPEDDATLVLYAPEGDPATLAGIIEPALAAAGIDGDGGPDLLALAVPAAEGDPTLGDSAHALLTRGRTLGDLPRFDETRIEALRALARGEQPAPAPAPVHVIGPAALTDQERFDRDLAAYRAMPGGEDVRDEDLFPQLGDWRETHELDSHYFHQDVWAANRVAEARPARHVDIGSRIDVVGFLTAITEVVFVDIRPLHVDIERLTTMAGSILDLPFADQSLESVSSLHVVEHIGLGRYGDPLDPEGSRKAMAELQRVVAPGGHLLFSGPIGRPRVQFNAHRIHDPVDILERFNQLELIEFSVVDDFGRFSRHRDPAEFRELTYGCGMFLLRRPEAPARATAATARPEVSFVIPAYNCEATISATLRSVLDQRLDVPYEVVVCDDASTDRTREILARFAAERPDVVRVMRNPFNRGGGATRNVAITAARGDLIRMVDSDNLVPPGAAAAELRELRRTGLDAASVEEVRFFTDDPEKPTHSWHLAHRDGRSGLEHVLTTSKVPASHGNYLFTRRLWEAVGGYDEGRGAMDAWTFGMKHAMRGFDVAIVEGTHYPHRYGHDSYWTREDRANTNDAHARAALSAQLEHAPAWVRERFAALPDDVKIADAIESGMLAPKDE
ncbi:MAG TPA: glycosyltransferase [Solirubrobacteraceae bacterium]|nr:glycosyltransferase [Solirubrobacteraceae bacterium]